VALLAHYVRPEIHSNCRFLKIINKTCKGRDDYIYESTSWSIFSYLKDLEVSKYKRESKARMPIKLCCLIFVNCGLFSFLTINCFFKQIVDNFFNKAYYQESYMLIIEYRSVVTVAEWLDESFECQSRF
jgi:hypothetical protein